MLKRGDGLEALAAQCLARLRASEWGSQQALAVQKALARLAARIVSSNRQRGRVPQDEAPNPRTGVSDSYIDRVLFFLRRERHILRALRRGEEAAWAGLLETLSSRAYRYLLQRGVERGQARQLAQDLGQAAAMRLWERALERFPYDTSFNSWASRLVAFEVSRWGRSTKEQREQRALSLDGQPGLPTWSTLHEQLPDPKASRALEAAEMRLALEGALQELPSADQREAVLRQLAGQSGEEIARALGRSPQAVYSLRSRALKELRGIMGSC